MTNTAPIRVMLVDDSAFARAVLTRLIDEAPDLEAVGHARDGHQALKMISDLDPDVITLDVMMPRMNGLTMLRQLMRDNPKPVVMISSLTKEGAHETIRALTYGAVDFVAKPDSQVNIASIRDELLTKVRQAANAQLRSYEKSKQPQKVAPTNGKQTPRYLRRKDKVIVIGSSTGGPRALNTVIPQMPGDVPAAVLIVQHMPPGFTKSLAERLNESSRMHIKLAEAGDQLKAGLGLVAPGGHHMVVDRSGQIQLKNTPPIHGVRPAVDATLMSVAQHYQEKTVAVILTGMGSDGTNGAGLVRAAGGQVITEDEKTCVVWGMPRSVSEAGYSNISAPIDEVSSEILNVVL